jgi:anthranilate synthase/aminodeoxychorismate synthase-like glutamine amidotransferase
MKVFLLDNYDSFTYNLVQYLGELGADIEVFRNDKITVDRVKEINPNAIVLSPGPGRPEHAGIMNSLIQQLAGKVPILGVCLGHQAIGQVYGARITYAPTLMHGKTSEVSHDGSTLFVDVPTPFTATRYHSLVIDKTTLPKQFAITAWAENVIMGIEHTDKRLFGVQFHPESILTSEGKKILKNFLRESIQ